MSYHNRQRRRVQQTQRVKGRNWVSKTFWFLVRSSVLAGIAGIVAFIAIVYRFYTTLPDLDAVVDGRTSGSVTFLDRNGQAFAWRGEQYDNNLRTTNAAPSLINAVIATEDKRFYSHFGISIRGITRALLNNYRENGSPFQGQGGSTITTQVAKLMCLGVPYNPDMGSFEEYERDCRRSTLERKLKEIPYSVALEWKYSKDDILSIYLNRAYLGAGSYGFGAAAKRYFGISAGGLDIQQSAMLAGMLTAPSRYAPTNDLQRSQDRSQTVMRLMREQGYITEEEYVQASASPATLDASVKIDEGVFFADWLMQSGLEALTTETSVDVVYRTTYDPRIQSSTEEAIRKVAENNMSAESQAQVAVVVMERTGAVRAMVGGRFEKDRIEQGFNRATQAQRQPGSSFKPFVYAAGLEAGMHPYDYLVDTPITVNVPGSGHYTPKNYTGRYQGEISLIQALKDSVNTIAVQVSENAARSNVRQLARNLGIYSKMVDGPSLALGSGEVNLLEITTAYAGLLNKGRPVKAYGWTELGLKETGELIQTNEVQIGAPVMNDARAGWLIYMMKQVVDSGTGTRARISGHQLAGKTGTTNEVRDAWFIGFSSDWVVGVWMGNDDNTPLKGTTGGGLPAAIWRETMSPILAQYGSSALPMNVPKPKAAPVPESSNDAGEIINQLLDLLLN